MRVSCITIDPRSVPSKGAGLFVFDEERLFGSYYSIKCDFQAKALIYGTILQQLLYGFLLKIAELTVTSLFIEVIFGCYIWCSKSFSSAQMETKISVDEIQIRVKETLGSEAEPHCHVSLNF